MRVLLVGYHNPSFINSMVYRDKAIEYLGHELISFEDRAFFFPGRIRQTWQALNKWDLARLNRQLIKCAKEKNPDLCIVVGGQRVLPETVGAIKRLGIKTALWTTDAPVDFKNILDAAPLYDRLFCAGTEARDIFESKGLRDVEWVPFGCDPNFHKPVVLTEEDKKKYGRDIVFVGSYYPNREHFLESIADLDLQIWGPYWSRMKAASPLKNKVSDAKLNYDQWVKIYNAAKISLVVHYQDPHVPCFQASPKLFEAMACGACVFSDRQKDVVSLFEDNRHLVFFNGEEDLRKKAEYYLAHDQQRRAIAEEGYREVIAKHTYTHRMEKIISVLCSNHS